MAERRTGIRNEEYQVLNEAYIRPPANSQPWVWCVLLGLPTLFILLIWDKLSALMG
jgi:hypothetical protein